MEKNSSSIKINILIILFFLILPWFFFNDSIKIGSVIFGNGDPNYTIIPFWDLIKSSFKNGEFPFWNSFTFSGSPFFANPQSYILYPFTLLFISILPLTVAYNLSILIHYSLAGIFVYFFLDQYKLDKFASFLGGLVFMFSGVMITHKGHAGMLFTIVWIPLILFFLDKFRKSRRYEYILVSSIFYSISFFGGNPQMFFYGSMVIFLFILYYSFINIKKQFFFLLSLSAFIISFLIILVQLFPIYEFTQQSIRSSLDYGSFTFLSYSKKLVPTLFFPFIYGAGPSGVNFFGSLSFIETISYFGLVTIPFLIFGFFSKNKSKYFWIFLLIFSFILVLGMNTPFYKLMYRVPIYNLFRIPTRNWFEFGLSFSIISAFGFDYFIRNFNRKIKTITIIILVISSFFLIGLLSANTILKKIRLSSIIDNQGSINLHMDSLLETTRFGNFAVLIPILLISLLVILMTLSLFRRNKIIYIFILILVFFDLRFFGNYIEGSSDASYVYKNLKEIKEFDFLKSEEELIRLYPVVYWGPDGCTIYPNRNIHYDISLFSGYDPLIIGSYNYITGIVNMDKKEHAERLLLNNNIISLLNTKYILYFKPDVKNSFVDSITKVFYEINAEILTNNDLKNLDIDLKGSFIDDKNNLIVGGKEKKLKCFKTTVELESNKNYLISFKIKKYASSNDDQKIDNNIFVDFYGQNYDHPEQEFIINPTEINDDYQTIRKTIFSNEIPYNEEINFRIFTYSQGQVEIRDLNIYEVDIFKYDNYEIIYDEGPIILENIRVLPRFYFVNEIRIANNLEEIGHILWEDNIILKSQRFDPSCTALVETSDFIPRTFNNENTQINIINYSNNRVVLETDSQFQEFLVFSDTFYPGWKAFIDGQETRIYKTNGIVKGVLIPPGMHEVEFRFLPSYFWLFFSISISSLVISLILILFLILKRKKKEMSETHRSVSN